MSPLKFIAYLVGGLFLILVLAVLLATCQGNKPSSSLPSQVVTRTTDTVYLPSQVKYQVKVVPKLIPVHHYHTKVDTFLLALSKDSLVALLTTRNYQDTLTLTKGLRVAYRAQVRGQMDSLSLGIVDNRPITQIVDSVKVTTILPSRKWGVYVGGLVSPTSLSPGVQFTNGKRSIGLHYNLVSTSPPLERVTLSYHQYLFGK